MLQVTGLVRPDRSIVYYAVMPVKKEKPHSLLRQLPNALRARMEVDGVSQIQLAKRLSVGQPQISRALAGRRKRLTEPMQKLCLYAGLITEAQSAAERHDKLNTLVRDLVGDSAPAAKLVEGVMLSLVPIVEKLRAQE